MKDLVFVDASAWIALLNADDSHHSAAKALYDELLKDRVPLITSTWTLYEALFLLKTRRGHDQPRPSGRLPTIREWCAAVLKRPMRLRRPVWTSSSVIRTRRGEWWTAPRLSLWNWLAAVRPLPLTAIFGKPEGRGDLI